MFGSEWLACVVLPQQHKGRVSLNLHFFSWVVVNFLQLKSERDPRVIFHIYFVWFLLLESFVFAFFSYFVSWSWFIPLRTLDRCYPWLYFPLLFARVVGGRKGHFDRVRSRMVLEDHLWQRNDEGKQLKFGTSLCIDYSPALLGGGTWAFVIII